jgi:carotenoid 1,2-hydratase
LRGQRLGGPAFDRPLSSNGYAWWYLDALSDDREHGIVIIAMLGNVFSPYYAAARRRGLANPLDFVTLNVAVYSRGSRAWSLTERRGAYRDAQVLAIGPSSVRKEGDRVVVEVNELTAPLRRPIRGKIVLDPVALSGTPHALDAAGAHTWWPIAPHARVSVELSEPSLRFEGGGYLDANAGDEPLEDAFVSWNWSRMPVGRGALVSYAVQRRDGGQRKLDLLFGEDGATSSVDGLVAHDLPSTGYRLARETRAERWTRPALVETLEDTPFYSRSSVRATFRGHTDLAMHESLSLDRFRSRWVQALLPMRIRRVNA